MRARAVHYTLKPDRWDDAQSALRSLLDEIKRQDGLESYINMANPETGTGTVISIFSTSEALNAAEPTMKKLLTDLDAYMKLTPIVEVGDVVAHIIND
ncbi:MAG TPA: hypothetical protein VIW94_05665 [Acidimicrobiia bacterium]